MSPIHPKAASVAGNKKIPEPIMFPVTRAVLDQSPIFFISCF